MIERVVHKGDKFAVGRGADTDSLLGPRAMADGLKHHVAGHHKLDGAVQVAGRGGGDQAVCPGPKLASEAGAKKAGNDANILWRHPEHLGQHIAMVHDRLRGFVEGKVLSIPGGDTSVELDWVVGLGRRDIGFVYLDGGG